ncbi:MAG: tetratricopeptide repeat protein [Anaerolineae bacterium]|nr:tetratricopeptide repeat protein [Anaerolineae bacterium]
MLEQIRTFLGPARIQALILLFGLTGLISLILKSLDPQEAPWATDVQSILVIVFLVGAGVIIGSRMDREARLRWLALLAPAIGALLLGLTVLPNLLLPLAGAAVGWIVAGIFIFRPRIPRQFQVAVRHMRNGEYDDAVKAMNELIKEDPENEDFYRFRAEIFRLWGKLDRARKDYEQMIEIVPDSAVAYNGLAEVQLQSGRYAEAREAGLRAYELAPEVWVAAYNLGMIEDRLGDAAQAVVHLQEALKQKIPDARHRLLMHLYLARAYSRLGDTESAHQQIDLIKRQRAGLDEWQHLLEHEQAAPLRAVLADDVQLAQDLIDGRIETVP